MGIKFSIPEISLERQEVSSVGLPIQVMASYPKILSHFGSCCVTYKMGFWIGIIGFIAPYIFTHLGTTGNTALSLIQFTVTHALGFSVFTSRILATDV
jgi:hypothetical protein